MNYISCISDKKTKCNLFADFILKKLGVNSSSVIHVVDNKNFLVVNGYSDVKDILNMNDITKEFNKFYSNLLTPLTHTIDLIEYGQEVSVVESVKTILFLTSDNNSYHHSLLENYKDKKKSFFFDGIRSYEILEDTFKPSTSEFPHGYSLNQGRSLYYYSKFIGYNICREVIGTKLSIELSLSKLNPIKHVSVDWDEHDEKLESYILDSFNFNYEKIVEKIKKVDLSIEVTNPLEDFDFLKEKIILDLFI